MNIYQRKTLFVILAVNVVFGLQQYLMNQAIVFPSPINAIVFLLATFFFIFKSFLSGTKFEKLLLLLFGLVAIIKIATDSFIMEFAFSGSHEQVYEWINSDLFRLLQTLGVGLLLISIPIIANELRQIHFIYFISTLLCFIFLFALAFINISIEPLFGLGLLSGLFWFVLIKHQEQILVGVSASMYLWIIFFFHEAFEYWNLSL